MASPMRFPIPVQTGSYVVPGVEVHYPIVYGLPNPAAQEKMNAAIRSLVGEMIEAQRAGPAASGGGATTMTGLYEIKTNERGVLSLTLSNYAYTAPAAHGLTLLRSLTFDAATGRAYSLPELFRNGTPYKEVIDAEIRRQIEERDVPLVNEFGGIASDQAYYIADKALVVYFQLYELTPYVYGFPMFPISVYDLESYVVEAGPLGRMLPGA